MEDTEKMKRRGLIDEESALDTVMKALEIGMPLGKACAFACISRGGMEKLLDRGARDVDEGIESREAELYIKAEHSKAVFQHDNLEIMKKAGESGSWQAAAWLLERRCPEDFASQRNKGEEIQRIQIVSDVPVSDAEPCEAPEAPKPTPTTEDK